MGQGSVLRYFVRNWERDELILSYSEDGKRMDRTKGISMIGETWDKLVDILMSEARENSNKRARKPEMRSCAEGQAGSESINRTNNPIDGCSQQNWSVPAETKKGVT